MRRLACVAVLAVAACSSNPKPGSVALQAADPARCAALADSTSTLRATALPPIRETPRLQITDYPRDVRDGKFKVVYRVSPDGRGDPSSILITGTNDARFRSAFTNALMAARFQPVLREGCPVWSRGELQLMTRTEVRQMN